MSYYLVDEGFINLCVCIGILGGLALGYLFILLFRRIDMVKLKKYFIERNDADKNEIVLNLDNLDKTYFFLAMKTNTRLFRVESNRVLDLINYLRRKGVD